LIPEVALNPTRLITAGYVVVLAFLGVLAAGLFFDAHAEYKQLKRTEATLAKNLADAEERLKEQKLILERLRTDPAYVEKVIFQQLDYAKPTDVIFRFQ
jgi:cell division protein FtsB